MASNYIEGKIVVWTIGGSFLFSFVLLISKIFMAVWQALMNKVYAFDEWVGEDTSTWAALVRSFIEIGKWLGKGVGLLGS